MENQEKNANNLFDSSSILIYIFRSRKHLLIVGLIAAIVSAIASYFIESRYKSTVIMVPTTTISISSTLVKEGSDILKFGEEKEAEQMIQILNSDTIRERICKKYNLMKHYKISEKDPYKKLYLRLEFDDRIWFSRTPSSAVEIDVLDKSPDTAACIANDIAALVDSTKNRLQKERATQYFQIIENEYLTKKQLIDKLQDSMRAYTSQGVFDYEIQSAIIYKQYAKSIAKNNTNGMQQLDAKLKLVGQKGWDYVALRDYTLHERTELFSLKSKCDLAKIDVEHFLPFKYMINPAIVAEKRTTPIRWLVVLISTVSSVILALVVLLAMDTFKRMKIQL